jgi:ABC-type nitrate/sulfonate/bicarbonate transport system permease component
MRRADAVRRRTRRLDPYVLMIPLGLAVAWELACRLEILDPRFFVPLTTIVATLVELLVDGTLLPELAITLRRLAVAFTAAAAAGAVVGIASGVSRSVRMLTQPIVDTIFPIPKVALLPLLIIIVGLGETAFVLTASATAFFQVTLSMRAGVGDVDPVLVEAGRNYGARGWRFLVRVLVPGMLPIFLNALRLAMGLSLITILAVEFVAARSGIGFAIKLAWQQLHVAEMYAGILVAGLLGHLINILFRTLDRRLMPWRHTEERQQVRVTA